MATARTCRASSVGRYSLRRGTACSSPSGSALPFTTTVATGGLALSQALSTDLSDSQAPHRASASLHIDAYLAHEGGMLEAVVASYSGSVGPPGTRWTRRPWPSSPPGTTRASGATSPAWHHATAQVRSRAVARKAAAAA